MVRSVCKGCYQRAYRSTGFERLPRQRRGCAIDGCERKHEARGYCAAHYQLLRVNGTPERLARPSQEERFWAKVDRSDANGCWWWLGSLATGGYGTIWWNGVAQRAHRVSYEREHGAIAADLVLDHLCRNTACVNPAHLEAVRQRTNIVRGESPPSRHAAKTHCVRGHEFTSENTRTSRGFRECRACGRIRDARRRPRLRKK